MCASWAEWKILKIVHFEVLSFLILCNNTNHFLIRLWHVIESGFYMKTGDDQLSGWTEKLQNTELVITSCIKSTFRHVTIWSRNGSLLLHKSDDTSKQFFYLHSAHEAPTYQTFSLFQLASNVKWPLNRQCWVLCNLPCGCKWISFDDPFNGLLSTSNGQSLCSPTSRLLSPLQNFLNLYCTVCLLAVLSQIQLLGCYKLSLPLYDLSWTWMRKLFGFAFCLTSCP